MTWDVKTVEGAKLVVNGSETTLTVGESFSNVVITAARNAGYSKFRVFLNGSEIDPSDSPAIVSVGDKVEIMPYDKPAGIIG